MILLDTNLLARVTNSADPQCSIARAAIQALHSQREQLITFPQNLYEFWAVATRQPGVPPSGQNGLGMAVEQASQWLSFFLRRFTLLPDRQDLCERWHRIVRRDAIVGFHAHDARLVAAMESYGILRLLTFNVADFNHFPITLVDPAIVSSS